MPLVEIMRSMLQMYSVLRILLGCGGGGYIVDIVGDGLTDLIVHLCTAD